MQQWINSAKTKCEQWMQQCQNEVCQVVSDSASLPDPVALETEEQRLERKRNWHDVLEALGDYKCDAGMSFENVPVVVDIKTLKGRFIAHKFSTGWVVGVVKRVEKKKSVDGQFADKYKPETYCWTQKLNKEDYV
jgi:hypothetical protein